MRNTLILFIAAIFIWACSEKPKQEEKKAEEQPVVAQDSSEYRIEIIAGEANSFGYDIKKDGKLLIHQPHIPGVAGVRGFDTEEQARAAAQLMVNKMQKNIMPPTISEHEVDSIRSLQ